MALSFALINYSTRVHTVRSTILSISSPSDFPKYLMSGNTHYAQTRKVKRRQIGYYSRVATIYYVRGNLICVSACSAVVKLHDNLPTFWNECYFVRCVLYKKSEWNKETQRTQFNSDLLFTFHSYRDQVNLILWFVLILMVTDRERNLLFCFSTEKWRSGVYVLSMRNVGQKYSLQLQNTTFIKGNIRLNIRKIILLSGLECKFSNTSHYEFWKWLLRHLYETANFSEIVTDINTKNAVIESRNVHKKNASNKFKFYRDIQCSVRDNPSGSIHI